MKNRLVLFLVGMSVVVFGVVGVTHAQGLKNALGNVAPIGRAAGAEGRIENITGTIINGALSLVGLIFLLLMVYAGFLWMTARGDEGQVEKAQNIVRTSMIGIVLVVSAYAITVFITSRFTS